LNIITTGRTIKNLFETTMSGMSMHKRALIKYHSGGKWNNTCCGHQKKINLGKGVLRCVNEEMGFDCNLYLALGFKYKIELDSRLFE